MSLAAVMIVRDEQASLGACFDSLWDQVDEIVVCDTGSSDDTVGEAVRYAAGQRDAEKLVIDHFAWCDDFAAARNHAEKRSRADWILAVDSDDRTLMAAGLRAALRETPAEIEVLDVEYLYSQSIAYWVPRLCRNGRAPWWGRLHECREVRVAATRRVEPAVLQISHRQSEHPRRNERDERILRAWVVDEPRNARALSLMAIQHFEADRTEEGMLWALRAIKAQTSSRQRSAGTVPDVITTMSLTHARILLLESLTSQQAQQQMCAHWCQEEPLSAIAWTRLAMTAWSAGEMQWSATAAGRAVALLCKMGYSSWGPHEVASQQWLTQTSEAASRSWCAVARAETASLMRASAPRRGAEHEAARAYGSPTPSIISRSMWSFASSLSELATERCAGG